MEYKCWGIFRSMSHKTPRVYCDTLENAEKTVLKWNNHVIKEMVMKKKTIKKLLEDVGHLAETFGPSAENSPTHWYFSMGDKAALKILERLWKDGMTVKDGYDLILVYSEIYLNPSRGLDNQYKDLSSDCSIVLMKELGYKIDWYGETIGTLTGEDTRPDHLGKTGDKREPTPDEFHYSYDVNKIKGERHPIAEHQTWLVTSGVKGFRDRIWSEITKTIPTQKQLRYEENSWRLNQLYSPHLKDENLKDTSRGKWTIDGLEQWAFVPFRFGLFNKENTFTDKNEEYIFPRTLDWVNGRPSIYEDGLPLPCEIVFRLHKLPCTIDFWLVLDKPTPDKPLGTITFDTPTDLLEIDSLADILTETVSAKDMMNFFCEKLELTPIAPDDLPEMMLEYYLD